MGWPLSRSTDYAIDRLLTGLRAARSLAGNPPSEPFLPIRDGLRNEEPLIEGRHIHHHRTSHVLSSEDRIDD